MLNFFTKYRIINMSAYKDKLRKFMIIIIPELAFKYFLAGLSHMNLSVYEGAMSVRMCCVISIKLAARENTVQLYFNVTN